MSDFSSLYLLPILAASTLRQRRGALQVAGVSAVLYLSIVLSQYTTLETFPHWAVTPESGLPAPRFAQYVLATNLFGFLALGSLAGALADRLRFAGTRLATASETIDDLRAFNEHVINSLVSGLVTADADCRILTFNRAASAITGVPIGHAIGRHAAAVLGLPAHFVNRPGTLGRTRSQRGDFAVRTEDGRDIELGVTAARLSFPDGRTGYLFTFQDVTDVKRLERRVRYAAAPGGRGRDGGRHRPRNPQPAGVDVGLDAGAAGRAAADRRAGAAHGHRAARIGPARTTPSARSWPTPARSASIVTRFDLAAGGARHGAAAAQRLGRARGPRRRPRRACRPGVARRSTRTRCGRLSGTSRPTACAPCRRRAPPPLRGAVGRPDASGCGSRTRGAALRRTTSTASSSRSAARSSAAPGSGWRSCTASSPTRRAAFTWRRASARARRCAWCCRPSTSSPLRSRSSGGRVVTRWPRASRHARESARPPAAKRVEPDCWSSMTSGRCATCSGSSSARRLRRARGRERRACDRAAAPRRRFDLLISDLQMPDGDGRRRAARGQGRQPRHRRVHDDRVRVDRHRGRGDAAGRRGLPHQAVQRRRAAAEGLASTSRRGGSTRRTCCSSARFTRSMGSSNVIGRSPAMLAALPDWSGARRQDRQHACSSPARRGTGKELVARAIH